MGLDYCYYEMMKQQLNRGVMIVLKNKDNNKYDKSKFKKRNCVIVKTQLKRELIKTFYPPHKTKVTR